MKTDEVLFNSDFLICVYGIRNESEFILYYSFDSRGIIEKDIQHKVFQGQLGYRAEEGAKWLGPFKDLPGLNKYAYSLCEKLDREKVCLISISELNEVFEESNKTSDVLQMAFARGDCMENLGRKKKSSPLSWFISQ